MCGILYHMTYKPVVALYRGVVKIDKEIEYKKLRKIVITQPKNKQPQVVFLFLCIFMLDFLYNIIHNGIMFYFRRWSGYYET